MLALLDNCLAALCALWIVQRTLPTRDLLLRSLGCVVAFGILCGAVLLLLGLPGWLHPPAVTGTFLALALMLGLLRRRLAHPRCDAGSDPDPASKLDAVVLWLALALLGALACGWTFRTLGLGTGFLWDDLAYHAAIPARWMVDGAITLVPFTYQAYYPQNVALLSLWFMLPLWGDALASLAVLYWMLVATLSMACALRALGVGSASVVTVLALFLASKLAQLQATAFSAPDLAAASMVLAGSAFALSQRPGQPSPPRPWIPLWSGLALGFAIGCKVTHAPLALVLAGWIAWTARSHGRSWHTHGLAFLAGLLATGAFWYLRNLLLTGNPVFPAELGPFEGPFTAAAQQQTQLLHWVLRHPDGWLRVYRSYLDWPGAITALCLAGYAAGAWRVVARRGGEAGAWGMLLLMGLAYLVIFPLTPFSGTINRPSGALHHDGLRFLTLPCAVGLLLLGGWMDADRRRPLWLLVCLGVAVLAWQPGFAPATLAAGGALATLLGWGWLRRRPTRISPLLAAAAFVAAWLALLLWTPTKARLTAENLFRLGAGRAPIGSAWRAVDALPPGSRVAFFMAEPYEYTLFHPMFGRRFQLTPVPLQRDGSHQIPLHERESGEGSRWWHGWQERRRPLDAAAFRRNLEQEAIDYVLVTRFSLGEWPAQYRALLAGEGTSEVYRDEWSVIWELSGG